jgi:rhodanese-related sulfurtransferase
VTHLPKIAGSALHYAGDIEAADAWTLLKDRPDAQLLDVRSAAEWQFVGLPDLEVLKKAPLLVELQSFPGMALNPRFVDLADAALKKAGAGTDSPVLCLCRSGARSRQAAMALTEAGYKAAYNIASGFEGDPDAERHRGRRNGWKTAGLPWVQS